MPLDTWIIGMSKCCRMAARATCNSIIWCKICNGKVKVIVGVPSNCTSEIQLFYQKQCLSDDDDALRLF